MSYLRAEEVLPKEVLELVQQYVDGQAVYIPSKAKRRWGEGTDTKKTLECRNRQIVSRYADGASVRELAAEYFLTEKSIWRIIKKNKQLMLPESGEKYELQDH